MGGRLLVSPELVCGRPGEGSRKVLEDMELELGVRWREPPRTGAVAALPRDELDSRRCSMRFDWTSSTDVGLVVWLRNAAAAAADDRALPPSLFAVKALVAAVCADADGVVFSGC